MAEFEKVSFVIPCYRSEHTILLVVDEIEQTMEQRSGMEYEIILVNDGSPDRVWDVIENRIKSDRHVVGIHLAKNFGQHSALMAGYNHCTGDLIVSLDDDGQTPASEVFSLIDELQKGYDVVFASYPETRQNLLRRMGSDFANKMTAYVFDLKEENQKGSSYYVMRRFVMDEMIQYKHPYPYIGGLILRVTRNIGVVHVNHRARLEGRSGYTFRSLVSLWLNGFTAFSVKPLELGAYVGFGMSAAGFLYAVYIVVRRLCSPYVAAGWSSLCAILLIVSGMIMIMLGLIGEYIGRIYICINHSPQYVIKEICRQEEKAGEEDLK